MFTYRNPFGLRKAKWSLEVLCFMILWYSMPCILLDGGKSVSQGGQTIMMEVKGAGASLKWILEGGSNVNWLFWSS